MFVHFVCLSVSVCLSVCLFVFVSDITATLSFFYWFSQNLTDIFGIPKLRTDYVGFENISQFLTHQNPLLTADNG